jgi:hypothetical protein
MEQDQFCNILCQEIFKSHDVQAFKAIIKEEYHHNWIIDNLPVRRRLWFLVIVSSSAIPLPFP